MGRSGSRSGAAPKRSGAPPPSRVAPPPPAPVSRASAVPAPAAPQQGGGMLAGLAGTVAQGFAFGTGSAIAHRAVGAVAESFSGSSSSAPTPAPAPSTPQVKPFTGPCELDQRAFMKCLQENSGNVNQCDFYYNSLQQCQSAQI